jgi:hypothetical protein
MVPRLGIIAGFQAISATQYHEVYSPSAFLEKIFTE